MVRIVKELLKSANIWQSYSKNKSGPVFLTHSVVLFYTVDDDDVQWFNVHLIAD